jgi:hypothetical protein
MCGDCSKIPCESLEFFMWNQLLMIKNDEIEENH